MPEALKKLWPRPRIGQKVVLGRGVGVRPPILSGREVEVVGIMNAADVIRGLSDRAAVIKGTNLRSSMGPHWMSLYYEAEVLFETPRGGVLMAVVTPHQIETMLD